MTDFHVQVVRLGKIGKHPNADNLSITQANGCCCVFRTGDFQPGDLAVHVPHGALLPKTDPRWDYLGGSLRVKPRKIRGVFSLGLLTQAPPGTVEGQDVAELLGITKWENLEEQRLMMRGLAAPGPEHWKENLPVYDIEPFRKEAWAIESAALDWGGVVITEKIHGANARFCLDENGKLHVGSRKRWLKEDDSPWWRIARDYELARKLNNQTNTILYGEVYGPGVQDMPYDCLPGEVGFKAFDLLRPDGSFVAARSLELTLGTLGLPMVPVLYMGPYLGFEATAAMSDGPSRLARGLTPPHFREGFVIKPMGEAWHPRLGRVVLKMAGETYLLRKG